MAADCLIGVDQGTSGTKAVLLDTDGLVIAEAGRPIAVSYPRPGWVEQDPAAIVHNVVACVRELLEKSGRSASQVVGLGIDNHTETLVLWDRDSGEPVHPAIVWQCRRSMAEVEALDSAPNRRLIRERTGLDLDPTFTATKLLWVFRNRQDIAEGLRAGRVLWGTLDCWILWSLTGGACYGTEPGNASRTMLFAIGELAWDPELIELFQLALARMPDVRPSAGTLGRCHEKFFGAEIPITAALGDQQAALLGHGCLERGAFKCTYGTGAFVWCNGGHDYVPSLDAGYLQTVAWALDRPTYALEGFIMSAGAVLEWLARNLGIEAHGEGIARLAEEAGHSGGVCLVPALQGLASPWWDPDARAALLGLASANGSGEICHAALEAICFQVRRVLEAMADAAPPDDRAIRVDGGVTRSTYLLQMQADILGRPVEAADRADLTPYGVGLLAGLGAGVWSGLEALEGLTPRGTRYEPRAESLDAWSADYGRWCEAVELCRAWNKSGLGQEFGVRSGAG